MPINTNALFTYNTNAMKHAKQYFKKYKTANVLYFTADDLAFTEKQAAATYAAQLDDSTVIAITRQEANAAMKDMEDDGWLCLTDYNATDSDDE